MKPMGPLPPEFAAQMAVLHVGRRDVGALVAKAGTTPLFVYDLGIAAARVARFRAAFPGIDLHYAMKANPHPGVVAGMAAMVDGLDVASGGEMDLALRSKPAGAISFAGPGKRDRELDAAIAAGVTLNVESEGETDRALAIAERLGVAPRLAVRVNPDMELRGSGMRMGGRPSPFGVDEARVPALVRRIIDAGAEWRGLHVYAGSQALDAQAIVDTQAETLALAGRIAQAVGVMPPLVNLGGGFGIPYFSGDTPLDIECVGRNLRKTIDNTGAALAGTRFAIELGRWLIAEAGVYLTRVVDRKESRGETFLVVDGGLHHQLAASGNFGTVVRRNYPVAVALRMDEPASETVSVVGCLCTPLDRLADRVSLPWAGVGDVIAIFLAGAYGATASPTAFLGHPPAAEIVLPPS